MRTQDEDLVAEQPGLSVFFIGLFVACVLGFLVRGLLSEDRIKAFVDQEISKHQNDFKAQVDRSFFQLANGAWPDFALVVRGLRLDSVNPCWMSPSVEVTQVRFPLSFLDLLRGKISLPRIDIDQAVVLLRSDSKQCASNSARNQDPQNREPSSESTDAKAEPARPSIVNKPLELSQAQLPFQNIYIQKLRLNYLPLPFTSMDFQAMELHLQSLAPVAFAADGQLILGGETLSGDYASRANWKLKVDEDTTPSGKLELSGAWREGRYDMSSKFDLKSKEYDLGFNLNHLPLSQLFPVLKKYKIMLADLSGKQSWLSMQVRSQGTFDHMARAPWKLSEIRLEGDLGEVSTPLVDFKSLEPLQFEPVQFKLSNLSFNALLDFLNRSHPSPALGQLGLFNGEILFKTPDQMTLTGSLKDFEMIFANKGSRQLQKILQLKTEMVLTGQDWNGQIEDIQLERGELDGKIQLHMSKNMSHLDVTTDFKKLRFNPAVESLMTQGGSTGVLSGKIKAGFVQGVLSQLEGQVRSDEIKSEGIELQVPVLTVDTLKNEFEIRVEGAKMVLPLGHPILRQLQNSESSLQFDHFSGQFKTAHLKDLHWKNVKLKSAKATLTSSGGWNESNDLYGAIEFNVLNSGKKVEKWNITGNREQPILSKKE